MNIGTNRLSTKLETGVSKNLKRWLFEVSLADSFYQDNTNFYGGRVREQESIASLQRHAVYRFAAGVKLAASTGVSTRTGTDFDTVAAVWQYAWGGS